MVDIDINANPVTSGARFASRRSHGVDSFVFTVNDLHRGCRYTNHPVLRLPKSFTQLERENSADFCFNEHWPYDFYPSKTAEVASGFMDWTLDGDVYILYIYHYLIIYAYK